MRMITLRLSNDQYTELHHRAGERDLSLNSYILKSLGFKVEVVGKPRGRKRQPPVNINRPGSSSQLRRMAMQRQARYPQVRDPLNE